MKFFASASTDLLRLFEIERYNVPTWSNINIGSLCTVDTTLWPILINAQEWYISLYYSIYSIYHSIYIYIYIYIYNSIYHYLEKTLGVIDDRPSLDTPLQHRQTKHRVSEPISWNFGAVGKISHHFSVLVTSRHDKDICVTTTLPMQATDFN